MIGGFFFVRNANSTARNRCVALCRTTHGCCASDPATFGFFFVGARPFVFHYAKAHTRTARRAAAHSLQTALCAAPLAVLSVLFSSSVCD